MPLGTKSVTRPGPFGNPFIVNAEHSAEWAVEQYERIVSADPRLREIIRRDLRGYNLACYCKPGAPCHADVLLRIANE